MTSSAVDQIARAVLYEGYLLYPYRQSALKNLQRWNFGVLYPPSWAASQTGTDRCYFRMECVASALPDATVQASVRFLRLSAGDPGSSSSPQAAEQCVNLPSALMLSGIAARPCSQGISLSGTVEALAELSARQLGTNLFRITLQVTNTTLWEGERRDDALLHALVSAHALLELNNGAFVSQTDPPNDLRDTVSACQNTGVWPVLVGAGGAGSAMLGSPIILSDYPQIAPESRGDLFDSSEIDEILTLRILTLTDAEKEEARRSDVRVRQLLERVEADPREYLAGLHGAMRGLRQPHGDAWSAWDTADSASLAGATVAGVELRKGDRVRLLPRKRADIFDSLLAGKIAVIEAVEVDFEGAVHFAVVLEDDPGRDLGEMRQAGHRFFFSQEEVEPVCTSVAEGD